MRLLLEVTRWWAPILGGGIYNFASCYYIGTLREVCSTTTSHVLAQVVAWVLSWLELVRALRLRNRTSAIRSMDGIHLVLAKVTWVSFQLLLCCRSHSSCLMPVTGGQWLFDKARWWSSSLFFLSGLLLSKLMLNLELSLLLVHTLIYEYIHQKELLLLSLAWSYVFLAVLCRVSVSLSTTIWGSQWPLTSTTFLHHILRGLWHLGVSGCRSTCLRSSTWPSSIYRHILDWLVSSTLSCSLHTLIFAIISAWSSLSRLKAIIYDKSRLVYI